MRWKYICLGFLSVAILLVFGVYYIRAQEKNDMTLIRERMLEALLRVPDIDQVEKYRKSLQPDGHWEDVNYEGTSTTSWEPAQHLRRLQTITQAWFTPD